MVQRVRAARGARVKVETKSDDTHAWGRFGAWLHDMIDPDTPFTISDTIELKRMIKEQLGTQPRVEVVTYVGKVFVRVDDREWEFDVAL